MDIRIYLTCLWPGLSELWWRGRLSAMPQAIGFAIVLNSLLTLTYLYPGWLQPILVRSGWVVAIGIWMYWTVRDVRELPHLIEPRLASDQPDRFPEAHREYLRGNWAEAESLLMGILAVDPRDPPALLLLSGVYRHTGKSDHAGVLVDELRRMEIADRWQIEIEAESARIRRDAEQETTEDSSDPESASDSPEDRTTRNEAPQDGGDAADLTAA